MDYVHAWLFIRYRWDIRIPIPHAVTDRIPKLLCLVFPSTTTRTLTLVPTRIQIKLTQRGTFPVFISVQLIKMIIWVILQYLFVKTYKKLFGFYTLLQWMLIENSSLTCFLWILFSLSVVHRRRLHVIYTRSYVHRKAQHSRVLTTKSCCGTSGSLPYVVHDSVLPWYKSPSNHIPNLPLNDRTEKIINFSFYRRRNF